MIYDIMFQNIKAVSIDERLGDVIITDKTHMPFGIYLEESNDIDARINNVINFNSWCANRLLSLDRKYAKEILGFYGFTQKNTDKERAKIALFSRCLSLNDSFWVKKSDETVYWEDVNLFDNSLKDAVLEVALLGESLTFTNSELLTPDISTKGVAPKAWQRRDDGFYLMKGDVDNSVIRESEASLILNAIGIKSIPYTIKSFNNSPVAECRCFTSKEVNLVTASDYSIWCMNNDVSFEKELQKYKTEYNLMNISDYLVGNNDRHPDNWGFLYDENMTVYALSPLMDYDHAFLGNGKERCQPQHLIGKKETLKEYYTNHIGEYEHLLDFDIDYSCFKYGDYTKSRVQNITANIAKPKNTRHK